jgi:hypothetical protein
MTVLASAIGPLVLAWCASWTGSYAAMFYLLAAVVLMAALAAAVVPLPPPVAIPERSRPLAEGAADPRT